MDVLSKAREIIPKGAQLLYLSEFGSHLYGTALESSEREYKGLYLPPIQDLVLMKAKEFFKYSTDTYLKNTTEDFNIELYSLQYWIRNLLKKKDCIGLDLFFSHTKKDGVLFKHHDMDLIFTSPELFIDTQNIKDFSYLKYAKFICRKYELGEKQLDLVDSVVYYLEGLMPDVWMDSLHVIVDALLKTFDNKDQKFNDNIVYEKNCIKIDGVHYPDFLKIKDFMKSLKTHPKKETKIPEINWEYFYQILKNLFQLEELLNRGIIQYPLKDVHTFLMKVRTGEIPLKDLSPMIQSSISSLENAQCEWYGKWDQNFANRIICSFYNL